MEAKDPGKLDFGAPLLSTRRPSGAVSLELPGNSNRDTHIRVPFSWEQSPGKPKESETHHDHDDDDDNLTDHSWVPPPRPPPGWQPPPRKVLIDQESEYDGDDDDNFFDTIDAFSLSEAFDIMVEQRNALGGLHLEPRGSESPSFIIQRFLSDAKALAASSGLNLSKNYNDDHSSDLDDFPRKWVPPTMESAGSSPKGCGLDAFFPWKMKHKPCSAKSPVRVTCTDPKHRCSTRSQKKNSSVYR